MDEEIIQEEEAIAEERTEDAARLGATILYRADPRGATMKPAICVPPTTSVRAAISGCRIRVWGACWWKRPANWSASSPERDVLTKVVGAQIDLDTATVGSLMTPSPRPSAPTTGSSTR